MDLIGLQLVIGGFQSPAAPPLQKKAMGNNYGRSSTTLTVLCPEEFEKRKIPQSYCYSCGMLAEASRGQEALEKEVMFFNLNSASPPLTQARSNVSYFTFPDLRQRLRI